MSPLPHQKNEYPSILFRVHDEIRFLSQAVIAVDKTDCATFGPHDDCLGCRLGALELDTFQKFSICYTGRSKNRIVTWTKVVHAKNFIDVWNPHFTAPFDFSIICRDRKSTRLNSSHVSISYAVFVLT